MLLLKSSKEEVTHMAINKKETKEMSKKYGSRFLPKGFNNASKAPKKKVKK